MLNVSLVFWATFAYVVSQVFLFVYVKYVHFCVFICENGHVHAKPCM